MPEELRFMMRSAAYSLFVGIVYWFLSYEAAGTILLLGVGLSASVMFGAIYVQWRGSGNRLSGPIWRWALLPPADAHSGTTNETGRLPRPSLAPLTAALGVALMALALVFGIWMALAGLVPALVGLRGWVRDAMAEFSAVDSSE
jgi:cytochrome c oxidase subunit IV